MVFSLQQFTFLKESGLISMKRICALILAACLCVILAAPASASGGTSPFVGSWKFYSQEGEAPMSHEDVLAAAAMGLDMINGIIVTFRDDGTMSMNAFGQTVEGTWSDCGDGTGLLSLEGDSAPMNVKDGFLRLEMPNGIGVFEPSEVSAEDSTAGVPPLLEKFAGQLQQQIQPPEQKAVDSPLVGQWRFYSMESADPAWNVPHYSLPEQLKNGRDYAGKYTLTFMDDGWFKFCNFYGFEQNNWTDSSDGAVTVSADGRAWECSFEDGLLVLRSPDCVIRYEKTVPIGSTGYHVVVPADFVPGRLTDEEQQNNMVACYRSDGHLLHFDISQFASQGQTLVAYAAAEAEKFGANGTDTVEYNGVPMVFYLTDQEHDGVKYRLASFLFAAGNDFGKLIFSLDGSEEAAELTEQILSSIFYVQPEPEDLHGVIVKKLEGNAFPDRYLVQGDDGNSYEGEYFFGFEDLAPGTAVKLSRHNGDWSIDLEDPRPAFG